MLFLLIILLAVGLAFLFALPFVAVLCVVTFALFKSLTVDMYKIFKQVFIENKTSVEL